jgi:hypothetical protein
MLDALDDEPEPLKQKKPLKAKIEPAGKEELKVADTQKKAHVVLSEEENNAEPIQTSNPDHSDEHKSILKQQTKEDEHPDETIKPADGDESPSKDNGNESDIAFQPLDGELTNFQKEHKVQYQIDKNVKAMESLRQQLDEQADYYQSELADLQQ